MTEDQDQENAELLAPYIVARNEAAHNALAALLDGNHVVASQLVSEYQLCCLAVESAMQVCHWFDSGTADQHIIIENAD
jgi:hypothetical protein